MCCSRMAVTSVRRPQPQRPNRPSSSAPSALWTCPWKVGRSIVLPVGGGQGKLVKVSPNEGWREPASFPCGGREGGERTASRGLGTGHRTQRKGERPFPYSHSSQRRLKRLLWERRWQSQAGTTRPRSGPPDRKPSRRREGS